MTPDQNPHALRNLADALSHDILRTHGEELLAEAAQDFGDSRALASEFDRAHGRASRRLAAKRAASRFARFKSWCLSALALEFDPSRTALASLAAALVVVIGVVIYQQASTNDGFYPTSTSQANIDAGVGRWPQDPVTEPASTSSRDRNDAETTMDLGDRHLAKGEVADALDAYNESLRRFELLFAGEPHNVRWLRNLASIHGKIGQILAENGKRADALHALQTSLSFIKMLAEREPDNAALQVSIVHSLYLTSTVSDPVNARDLLNQALAIADKLVRERGLSTAPSDWPSVIRSALAKLP